jgi:hypothetical protein
MKLAAKIIFVVLTVARGDVITAEIEGVGAIRTAVK